MKLFFTQCKEGSTEVLLKKFLRGRGPLDAPPQWSPSPPPFTNRQLRPCLMAMREDKRHFDRFLIYLLFFDMYDCAFVVLMKSENISINMSRKEVLDVYYFFFILIFLLSPFSDKYPQIEEY